MCVCVCVCVVVSWRVGEEEEEEEEGMFELGREGYLLPRGASAKVYL